MKVGFTSDLHGQFPEIEPCDVLVIAGDITPLKMDRNVRQSRKWFQTKFFEWVESIPADTVIFTPGNHDFYLYELWQYNPVDLRVSNPWPDKLIQLIDESVEINGLVFHGTPWCTGLPRWAFNIDSYDELINHYRATIPEHVDVLISHGAPALGEVSMVKQFNSYNYLMSYSNLPLTNVLNEKKVRYCVCGHIHSGDHVPTQIMIHDEFPIVYFNASYLDEDYKPTYDVRYINIER